MNMHFNFTRTFRKLLLFACILTGLSVSAKEYYWVGGTGNWSDFSHHWAASSGGSVFYLQIPQSVDNVHFDANSFTAASQTVTGDVAAVCNNMNWTGVLNNPTFNNNNGLSVYGSLTFVSGMSYNSGSISFVATTTGQIITTAGKTMGGMTFSGVGGGWTLQDNVTMGSYNSMYLNNGSLNTNGKAVSGGQFISNSGSTRSLTTGGSLFTFGYPYGSVWEISNGNITVSAAASDFVLSGSQFYGGGNTYHDITFTANGNMYDGGNTFHNATFTTGAYINSPEIFNDVTIGGSATIYSSNSYHNLTLQPGGTYQFSGTQSISGTFSASGTCTSFVTINGGGTISSANAQSISYVNLQNTHASGGGTFTASNTIDNGGNTGWTISPLTGKNLYWVGGTGNWSSGSHWSLTSGGTPTGCTPTSLDNVFFDANSFTAANQTVTGDVAAVCNNMNWTGVLNNPTFNNNNGLSVYGSLTFVSGMSYNSGSISFVATTTGQIITTAGKTMGGMTFSGVGGGWTLQDNVTMGSYNSMYLNNGSLNTNGKAVSGGQFISNSGSTRSLTTGGSLFTFGYPYGSVWEISNGNITVSAAASDFVLSGSQFYGGGNTYHDITFTANGNMYDGGNTFHNATFTTGAYINSPEIFNDVTIGGSATIYSSNSYHNLTLQPGGTYQFSGTQSISGTFSASGTCTSFVTINGGGTISSANAQSISYVNLQNTHASGGGTFTASNTIDNGGNTGWTISPLTGKNLYWVGGTGNWSSGSHWSLTSGGTPTGCTPTSLDNVFFDANSFTAANQTVTGDVAAVCNNMNWTGVLNNPTFNNNNGLSVYGSLTFVSGMSYNSGSISFVATTTGQIITTAGKTMGGMTFSGVGGGWTLQDNVTMGSYNSMYLNNGSLNTNGKAVSGGQFISNSGSTRSLTTGGSLFTFGYPYGSVWEISNGNITVSAAASDFVLSGSQFYGGGNTYHDITFTANGNMYDGGNTFHNATFTTGAYINSPEIFNDVTIGGSATIYSNNSYHNLTLQPGGTYQFNGTQTISGTFNGTGTGGFPVILNGTGTFSKASGVVCNDYIRVSNMAVTGGATWSTGPNSQDIGGNTGWNFAPNITTISVSIAASSPCYSSSMTFTATPVNGGSTPTYQWFLNGVSVQNSSSTTYTNNSLNLGDQVKAVLTASFSCGNPIVTPSNIITLVTPPTATAVAAGPVTFCSGGSVVLNAGIGSGYTYQWQLNGNPISGAASSSYTATASGSYRVAVSLGTCTVISSPVTVTVNAIPAAVIVTGTTTPCSVVLNANTGAGLTYQWQLNGNPISGAASSSYTATATGSYTVAVSNGSCSATSTATSVTVSLPAAIISAGGATTFCTGGSVVLNASTGSGNTYQWQLNGNSLSGATGASYTATAFGNYTVTVTNTGCSATSTATPVIVNALPVASISGTTTSCGTVSLTASGGTSYLWSGGSTPSSASNTFSTSGTYSVTVTNANNCSATASSTITVLTAISGTVSSTNPTCLANGTITITNPQGPGGNTLLTADFSTQPAGSTLSGNAVVTGGECILTPASSGTQGYIQFASTPSTPSAIIASFYARVADGSGADGMSFNYGVVNPSAPSYLYETSGILSSGISVGFSEFQNRITVTYNGSQIYSTSGSLNGSTYHNCTISINSSNQLSVSISGSTVISNLALPASYATDNKSSWVFAFAARCGGLSNKHSIDNVLITDNSPLQYSINGTTWQTATSFSVGAGSYTVQARWSDGSVCGPQTIGTATLVAPTNPVAPSPVTGASRCGTGTLSLSATPGTGETIDWYAAASGGSALASGSTSFTTPSISTTTIYYAQSRNTTTGCVSATRTAVTATVNPLPTATITAGSATTFCAGGSVVFTANAGTGYTYQWQKDGTNLPGATASAYTATVTGSYTVVVTASGVCTATSTGSSVTVNALPAATITAGGSTTFCSGGSVVLNANTGTGLTYQWQQDGSNIGGATSASYTATISGGYTVAVTNSNGCNSTSVITPVTVNPIPSVSGVSGATIICNGSSTALTASSAASSPTFNWYNASSGGSSLFTGASFTTPALSASTTYYAEVTSNGCVSASRFPVTVTVNSIPTLTLSSNSPICSGNALTFTASAATTYSWTGPNGFTSTQQNPSIANATISATGTYTLTALNPGCTASNASITVTVSQTPGIPVVSGPAVVCAGGSASLTATASTGSIVWWSAPTGGSVVGTGSPFVVTPSSTTTYYAEGTAAGGAGAIVNTLSTVAIGAVEINAQTGDDRGGIAVTKTDVYVNGDDGIGRFDHNLNVIASLLPQRDGIFCDINPSSSGQVWTLWNTVTGTSPGGINNCSTCNGTVNAIRTLDANMNLGSTIMLSIPIALTTSPQQCCNTVSPGIFSGSGYVLLYSQVSNSWYTVNLVTGNVTSLGTAGGGGLNATGSENWARWGWAEFDGTNYFAVYRDASGNSIVKKNITSGAVTTLQGFTSLSDMANIVYSPWDNRAYMHYEGTAQFRSGDETLTDVSGTSTTGGGQSCTSIARTGVTVTVNPLPSATITAGGVTAFCPGGSVVLNANTGTGLTYQWKLNGNNISGATASSYTAGATGTYTVAVTNSSNCSVTSSGISVNATDNTAPTVITQNVTVALNASGTATVTPAQVNNGSTDNCGIAGMTLSKTNFTCADISGSTCAGTALNFNGTSEYVAVNSTAYSSQGNDFTWEAWFKTSGNGTLISKTTNPYGAWATGGKSLFVRSGAIGFDVGFYGSLQTTTTWNDNNWHHVALTVVKNVSGTQDLCTIYVDGVSQASSTSLDVDYYSEAGLTTQIGYTNSNFPSPSFFPGSIDEVKIWNVARTAAQIAASYKACAAGNETGLVGYYKMNEGSGTTIGNSVAGGPAGSLISSAPAADWVSSGANVSSGAANTVTLTVTDVNGNSATGTATVTVVDNIAPTITAPANVSVNVNANTCAASGVTLGTPVTADNCGVKSVTNNAPSSYPLGNTTVTWTVTDNSNNTATATQIVTVTDNIPPIFASCPSNITSTATSASGAVVTYTAPIGTDNCSVATTVRTAGFASGSTFPIGTTLVTHTVTDGAGLTATCSFTVTVSGLAPSINCPSNITVNNTAGQCGANVSYTATESTGIPASTITYSIAPGSFFGTGTQAVTATATNAVGVSNCTFYVTVNDAEKPVITCPPNQFVNLDASCNATLPDYRSLLTVSDNCTPAASLVITQSPAGGTVVNTKGAVIVTFTVTDAAGNSNTCNISVDKRDITAPVIACPSPIATTNNTNVCGAVVTYATPTATDNCSGSAFNFFNAGEPNNAGGEDYLQLYNSGTWNDLNGNSSLLFIVEINSVNPNNIAGYTRIGVFGGHTYYISTFTQPWNNARSSAISIGGDLASINTLAEDQFLAPYGGSVWVGGYQDHSDPSYVEPGNAAQNFGGWKWVDGTKLGAGQITITQIAGLPSGATFPVGVTTNTFQATDESGNSSTCSFTVTVTDNQKPALACPSNITHTADAGQCSYSFTPATPAATDNCPGVTVAGVRSDAQGLSAPYPVGTTTITWTATDAYSNTTICTQTITVTDNEKPVITCSANVTHTADAGLCSYSFTPNTPMASDNCTAVTVAGVRSDAQGLSAPYPVGITTITWTATDSHGNSINCTQTVTVSDDENPVITCNANITHTADAGLCSYSFTPSTPVATDNCPGVTVTGVRSDALALNAPYPVGTTTITWTATDVHAHSVSCLQTITVSDNEKPTITAAPNQTQTADPGDCGAMVTVASPIATHDNCGVLSVTNNYTGTSSANAHYPVGTTTITWTVTDIHGNTQTATQNITVTDNEKPVIHNLPANITVNALNNNCSNLVGWTKPTATDNCAIASFASSDPLYEAFGFTILSVGVNTITYTATDIHGNSTTASFTVTVVDNQPPIITGCPSNITVNAATGRCDQVVNWNPPTASDNCPGVSLSTNHISGETFPVGTTTVTYTATDHAGLTTVCSFTVTVVDAQKPILTGVPSNITVECNAVPAPATVTATDNCTSNVPVLYTETRTNGGCPNSYTLTRVWSATDAAGNIGSGTQVIMVQDTQAPVLSAAPANTTVECDAVPAPATLTATDNCSTPIVTYTETRTDGGCPNSYMLTRVWTATDACGNASSKTQVITVQDTKAPVLAGVPADITVECDAVPMAAIVTATDNCDDAPVVGYAETRNSNACPSSYTLTRVWTAVDACGNMSSKTQTITVQDTKAPVLSAAPANVTVECDAVPAPATLTATDNCDGSPFIIYTQTRTNGNCPNNYTLTRTWTAIDACNNMSSKTQVITVQDTKAPVLSAAPANITVECDAVPAPATLTATDNCSTPVVTYQQTRTNGNCPSNYTLTRVWTATDACGNASSKTQVITVLDRTAPVLSAAPANITVECDAVPTAAILTATDNCDAAPVVTYAQTRANGNCPSNYTLTRVWTATDACGNASSKTQVITVLDRTAPVLSAAPANVTVECDAVPAPATLTATDNCDAAPVVIYAQTRTNGNCPSNYTLTRVWTATDACGNASSKTQVITVQDTHAPVLSAAPANVTVECDAVPTAATLTATDNCDAAPVVTYTESRTNGNCPSNYTLTRVWTATDACGNASSKTQVITVHDTHAPVLSAAPANVTVECDAVPIAATLTATDNCDAAPVVTYAQTRTNGNCPSNYTLTRTWIATDACGNASSKTQVITVLDRTAPVLSAAPVDVTVECDAVPTAAILTATDNCDAAPVVTYTQTRTDGTCANSYTLTRIWTATDACGNASSKTQTITVLDRTAPVLSAAPVDVTVECDAVPTPATLTATDNCDAAPVVTYTQTRTDGACPNSYTLTRTWTATDACNNASSKTQTITVLDRTAPVLSAAPVDITVECDAVPIAATLTATDNCDAAPVVTYAQTRTDGTCANSYTLTRTWTATDACNNVSSKTQMITVLDRTAPVLSAAPANVTVECDAVPAPATLTATDNCDAAPVVTYTQTRTDGACPNSYTLTRTWTATDACNNASSKTQTITVLDRTAPVLSAAPVDITVECDAVPIAATLTATDNCDAAPVVTYAQTRTDGTCANSYTLTRTWTATDACGNGSSKTQVITVLDRTAPVLSAAPANVTVECDAVPIAATLTATDNCDAAPVVTYAQTRTDGTCPNSYTLTRTWTATDACGNAGSKTQVITVRDTKAPVLSAAPANITVQCDAVPVAAVLTATDNCSTPVVTFTETRANGTCANSYTLTRKWTATDACGNACSKTQVITVQDTQAPILSAAPANVTVECDAVPAPATLTATDNCDAAPVVTYTQTRTDGTSVNDYTLTRTWTATDACGNAGSKTQTITVHDTQAPVLTVPSAISVNTDNNVCGATVGFTATATDNCGPVTITYSQNPATLFAVGTTVVTVTAKDASGNTTVKTFTVTVTDRQPAAVVTKNITIPLSASGSASIAATDVNNGSGDACGIATMSVSPNTFSCANVGNNTVTLTVTDVNGNISTKTATVTVVDNIAPTVITQNISVNLAANGTVSITPAQINNGSYDNCSIASYSLNKTSFTCANVGVNTVTLTVTDVNGNLSTKTATVTVVDNIVPTVLTQNISVNLAANGTVSITSSQINNGSTDNCGIATYTLDKTSFTCANVGANTVTLTVTDVNGNASTGTAVVTVQDNIAPTAITKNITVALNGSGQATVLPSQVDNGSNDNCSVALSFQCATTGGQNLFSNGDFTSGFTGWTVANVDNSGGWKATGGNPTGYYLLNSNGAAATDPTIQQTVTGLVPGQWYTISGQRNNIENGAFGNASALSFGVAVDNTVILQLANTGGATWIPFSVQFKATATSHVIAFSAERNGDDTQYGVDNLSVVATPPASCTTGSIVFNCSNIGVNTVKLVVTDPSGNTATQTATVTVVDNLAPVIALPANATVNCGTSTAPSATGTATAADNCSAATVTYSDVTTGNVITRTWKAVDVYGNTSTAAQTITIVDNIKPVVVNPADITVTCSTLTSPSITGTATATDNCGTPTVTYSDTWYNSTTLLRFWKATDGFGNVSNIINAQTITINDNIKPVITDVPDITVNCGASTLPAATGTATATDNCGTPTVTYSDVTSGNIITRTWKATDGFGNTATSTQVITVGAVFTASVSSVPTSSTYTGGVNTNLYLGYGAQSTTLQMGSLPSGGAPYTYSWSGSFTNKLSSTTVASPVFTPATFGYYTFSVTVTNKYGCTSVATINICVTDIRVAGTSGIGAKVYVCHVTTLLGHSTYTTLQVLSSAVSVYVNSICSDKLGSCDQSACNTTVANSIVTNNSGITKEGGTEVSTSTDELKVTVMPNPTNTFFTLKLESKYETPVSMRVMDANGRVIDAKSKIGANSTIQIGHNYSSGTYYAELIQGAQRKVVQMIKGRG